MEQKTKTYIRPIVIVMLFAFLTIGYAYLTSVLNINGSTLIKNPTWDVHFENVQVKDGSVTGEQVTQEPEIDSEQTTVSFHVNLKKPGDYYEFTVDAVNAGTIDAMINTYTEFDLTEDQLKYLETSVTYEDGEEIAEKQQLLAGDFAVYKIVVSFKKDISEDDLPSAPEQLDLTYTVEYVQKDDTAIERRAETYSLYNVLKNEIDSGLVRKFTGEHQDSMDASKSTRDIYHWYASTNIEAEAINNKNNVIFANHCWQMLRTTDTGGIKLIYNGEVENDKCLNTRGNHVGYSGSTTKDLSTNYYYGTDYNYNSSNGTFSLSGNISTGSINVNEYTCMSNTITGTCSELFFVDELYSGNKYNVSSLNSNSHYSIFGRIPFNVKYSRYSDLANYDYNSNTLSFVGYMHNKYYPSKLTDNFYTTKSFLDTITLTTNYWYADSIIWDSITNTYSLVNPYQISSYNDYANLLGKYTFASSSRDITKSTVYYISELSNNTASCYNLANGNNVEYYYDTYTFGDNFTDNGNGTYTISNPVSIHNSVWSTNWFNDSSMFLHKYYCVNPVESICSGIGYVTMVQPGYFSYLNVSRIYKYSNSFTYQNGKYTLDNNSISTWNITDNDNLYNKHYTCWNTSGECSKVSYVYHFGVFLYYIELSNGKSISDALDDMLYGDDVNVNDSTIKKAVDYWYKKYLLQYDNYIDDTIYCNDRSIRFESNNDWNPDSTDYSRNFLLLGINSNDLKCYNNNDSFSISNDKAKLNYKVGLITRNEMEILNSDKIRATGITYYTMSPYKYDYMYHNGHANPWVIIDSGSLRDDAMWSSESYGVRPAISLKPGTMFSSGDGSMANPYVIDTN